MLNKRPFAILISAFLLCCAIDRADAILFSGAGAAPPPSGLTLMTVTNPSASTATNIPFCVGLPFASGAITAAQHIVATDNDTGSPINVDEPNRASDINSAIRNESLCGVVPSATGSQKKQLTLTVASGAPSTGTDITVADITAYLTLNSFSMPVTFTDINGVTGTWTADLQTALASGNSGWVNKTTATVLGKYRSGGGTVTEYRIYAPAVKAGTPDAQMHVLFDLACFKAARTAVNTVTNPVLGCTVDVIRENAFVQTTTPVDDYYGFSVGVGGSVQNFPNSTPSNTLTMSGNYGGVYVTAASPLFSINSIGQTIADGTGVAVVQGYTDSTHALLNVYTPFASTTISSGTYKLYGTNHPYASRYHVRASLTTNVMPTVESGEVYLGAAWNGGTLTGGPSAYLISTGMMANYNFTASQGTNDLTNINNMGNNPGSYTGCGQQFGAGGNVGNITCYLEASGQRSDIGIVPDWDAFAMVRYDSSATTVIFDSAARWATYPANYRDQSTGLVTSPCNAGTLPSCAGNTNWTLDGRFPGTPVAGATNTISPWSPDQSAHDPAGHYLASILTGNAFYIENQQFYAFSVWANISTSGTGVQKTVYNNPYVCCGLQERGTVWGGLAVSNAGLLTPDSNPVLGWTKAVALALVANEYGSGPLGAKTLFIDETGNTASGKNWNTDGPHWTVLNNNSFSTYQTGYSSIALGHQYEQGMLDSNGLAFRNWIMQNNVDAVAKTTKVSPYATITSGYLFLFNQNAGCPGTYSNDWASVNQQTGNLPQGTGQLPVARVPAGTITLSATSGSSVTATFSGGNYFTTTGSYYVGGWLQGTSSGLGQITSVVNANTVVIDTTVSKQLYTPAGGGSCQTFAGQAFSGTSISGANLYIPGAAPGDPFGTDWTQNIIPGQNEYIQVQQAGLVMAKDQSVSGASAACTTAFGFTGGVMDLWSFIKWNWKPRTTPC